MAVIDEHHRWWSCELRERIQKAAGPDARGQILAMFDVMQEMMRDPEYHGCMFLNAAVEFPQPHHPAHQSARQAKADSLALLEDLAQRAGAGDPQSLAQEIDMIIEGCIDHAAGFSGERRLSRSAACGGNSVGEELASSGLTRCPRCALSLRTDVAGLKASLSLSGHNAWHGVRRLG